MGFYRLVVLCWASQAALMVENLPANSGVREDTSLIPGSGRSPGGGHGNPLQYSCLENPTDRRAWQPMVHRVTKSQIWLKQLSSQAQRLGKISVLPYFCSRCCITLCSLLIVLYYLKFSSSIFIFNYKFNLFLIYIDLLSQI